MRKSVPIIHTSAALESLKNRGITLNNAIRECVDNSWDWMGDARVLGHAKIRIHLVMNNGRLTVSILDNGQGIADHVEEGTRGEGTPIDVSTSTSIDGLQMALRVGGRIQKPRLAAIGRFGFGLPQSGIALCYDTHTRVYSKTKHGQWRWLDLNVNDMIASITQEHPQPLLDIPTPGEPSQQETPPEWIWTNSGTMVQFNNIHFEKHQVRDLLSYVEELKLELGRVYRYAIEDGLEISISSNTMLQPLKIPPYDPLCQMPASFTSGFGPIDEWETLTIDMDGGSSRPRIIDPSTGQPAQVVMRFVRLDPLRVREHLGVAPSKKKLPAALARKYGFNIDHQGFSLVRGDREIGCNETFGLFSPNQTYRYFRGEVRFPPIVELDRMFGIEPDKAKFRATNQMRGWMQLARQTLKGIAKKTNKAMQGEKKSPTLPPTSQSARPTKNNISRRNMEQHSHRLKERLPPIQPTAADAQLAQIRIDLENGERKQVELSYDQLIQQTELAITRAQQVGDNTEAANAQDRLAELKQNKEWAMKNLDERFSEPAFFRTHEQSHGTTRLLWSHRTDDGFRMVLNNKTEFYNHAYAATEDGSKQRAVFDLLLWAIAYAEANPTNSPEMKAFWQRIHPIIAQTADRMLGVLATVEVEEKPAVRRRKSEIASSICEHLGIEKPPELKGSTIPGSFYSNVLQTVNPGQTVEKGKHNSYRAIMESLMKSLKDDKLAVSAEDLSSGATITSIGLEKLENALLRGW